MERLFPARCRDQNPRRKGEELLLSGCYNALYSSFLYDSFPLPSFKTKEEAEVAVDMLHGYKFAGTKTGCLVVSLDDPSHSVKISESGGGIAIQDDAEEEGEVPGYVLGANERTCTLEAILLDNKKPTSIAPFECFICQYKFLTIGRAVIHIEEIHPDWQTEKGNF